MRAKKGFVNRPVSIEISPIQEGVQECFPNYKQSLRRLTAKIEKSLTTDPNW